MNSSPCVTKIDMGYNKPEKWAIWYPWPVYIGKNGTRYHIHPRKRYATEEAAQAALTHKEG